MNFTNVVRTRQSVRAFQPQQISDEQLAAVLDAAYNAPVGMGQFDSVQLIVVQNPEVIGKLEAIAGTVAGEADFHPAYGASTLIYVCEKAEDNDLLTGCNTGCIMENMLLAAVDEGLAGVYLMGMVQMANSNPESAQLLGVPEGYRAVSAAAVGYPAVPSEIRVVGPRMKTLFVK